MDDQLRREIHKRAGEVYDLALGRATKFDVDTLTTELSTVLAKAKLGSDRQLVGLLLADTARSAIALVDERRKKADTQATLPTLMDQSIALGGGTRIARKAMKLGDWATHLQHVSINASQVNASAARENARFSALAPYLGDGLTTEAAAQAWQTANPDSVLP